VSVPIDMTTARLFIAVAEEMSIAGAARRESIAASAISKRIGELEQRLGLPLLRRHAAGVEITPAGATVLRCARNLIHAAGQLEAELRQMHQGVSGHVRIAAGETTCVDYLPTVLSTFLQANPGIRVEIEERQHTDVVRAVQEQAADIGILPSELLPPDMWTRPCYRDRLLAVMRTDHPLAGFPGVTMAEILDHDIIGQDRRGALGALLTREAMKLGRSMRVRVAADGYDVVCRLAQEGLGIGIVAESSYRIYAASMGLISLPILDSWARRQHRVCVRKSEVLSPPARLLLDRLLQGARQDGAAISLGDATLSNQ
jgi:DNA-binding transcriptional LysR family regulator